MFDPPSALLYLLPNIFLTYSGDVNLKTFLFRSIHISWFIAWACGGFLVGVALSGALHIGYVAPFWLITSSLFLVFALIQRYVWLVVFVLLFGIGMGLWRGSVEQSALQAYVPFYGKTVLLQGVVSTDTSYGPHGDQRIMLKNIAINGHELHGQVWASAASHTDMQRSDVVTLSGRLGEGFGNLPASMFFAKVVRVARPQPGDVALHIRDWFADGIRRAISDPASALGIGYLTGQRSTLPENLDNDLKIVGLTHAVVASGYNLTILVVFARRVFLKKSKYLAMLSAAGMAFGFMLITGFSPSMTRAGIVTALGLAAWYYGRKVHPLVLLPLAAAITALLNPAYLWGDIGWSLSFAAFAGVLLLAPLIQHFFWGDTKPGIFREIFVGTMSAQIATMPIMLFAFGHYSPYALLANMLVLPLVPLTMLLTFVGGVVGVTVPGFAQFFGLPATIILEYMIKVVNVTAKLPGAQSDVTFNTLGVAGSYAAIVLVLLFLWRKTRHNFRASEASKGVDKSTLYV